MGYGHEVVVVASVHTKPWESNEKGVSDEETGMGVEAGSRALMDRGALLVHQCQTSSSSSVEHRHCYAILQ